MADVFILGAGFSRAVSQSMPLLGDLTRETFSRTSTVLSMQDHFSRRLAILARKRGMSCASFVFTSSMGNDIEIWLTYLSLEGLWDVVVTNPDGGKGTLKKVFEVPPRPE